MEKIKFETPLCELGFKYRTDKCPQIRHDYTPVYYSLLKDKRESFKKVLELGIGTVVSMKHVSGYMPGASHRMWRDFFPNAQIYGVDIAPECIFQDERITTFLYRTHIPEDMKELISKIGSDIDLVIDDGPHHTGTQIGTARTLLPLLKKDVLYIIEDTKNPERIQRNLPEYKCNLVKMPKKGADDNNLVIITK